MSLPANWHRLVYVALAIVGLLAALADRAIAAGQVALPPGSAALVLFACFVAATLLRPFYESLARDAGVDVRVDPVPLPLPALAPVVAAPVPAPAAPSAPPPRSE